VEAGGVEESDAGAEGLEPAALNAPGVEEIGPGANKLESAGLEVAGAEGADAGADELETGLETAGIGSEDTPETVGIGEAGLDNTGS
jgi:hypothetical protein